MMSMGGGSQIGGVTACDVGRVKKLCNGAGAGKNLLKFSQQIAV